MATFDSSKPLGKDGSHRETVSPTGADIHELLHGLRTPLDSLLGMVHILSQTTLTSIQAECADVIKTSALNILAQADRLSFRETQREPSFENCDIHQIVQEVLDTVCLDAHHKGLDLSYWIAPNLNFKSRCDVVLLRRALVIVVSNAVKHTNNGAVTLSVNGEQSSTETINIRFQVQDTGPGLDAARFAKTSSSATSRQNHLLAPQNLEEAHRLIEYLGGSLAVESSPNKGSRITCVVPLKKIGSETQWQPLDSEMHIQDKASVSIYDSNPLTIKLMSDWLEQAEMPFHGSSSLEESLQRYLSDIGSSPTRQIVAFWGLSPRLDELPVISRFIEQNSSQIIAKSIGLLVPMGKRLDPRIVEAGEQLGLSVLRKPIRIDEIRTFLNHAVWRSVTPVTQMDVDAEQLLAPILVVEDNLVNQKVLCRLLQKLGHQADTASGGQEALDKLAANRYSLVLLDLQMPGVTGFEVASRVRVNSDNVFNPDIPIVAVTAAHFNDLAERCITAGIDEVLPKPVDPIRLEQSIHRWLARRSMTRQSKYL